MENDAAGAEKTIAGSSDNRAKDLPRQTLATVLAGRGDVKTAARVVGEIADANRKSGAQVAVIAAQAARDPDAALAAVLVKLGEWDAALAHLLALEKSRKEAALPMSRAFGFAMARQRHGDQLLKLLPKIDDPACRTFICLGAAAACEK